MSFLDGSQTVLLTWTFLKLCYIPKVLTQPCHCGHTALIPMTPCPREIRWQLNSPCELDSLLPIFSVWLGRWGSMSKVTDVFGEKLHCKSDNKGRVKLKTLYKSYWATLKIKSGCQIISQRPLKSCLLDTTHKHKPWECFQRDDIFKTLTRSKYIK